jgi:hypothetical protein
VLITGTLDQRVRQAAFGTNTTIAGGDNAGDGSPANTATLAQPWERADRFRTDRGQNLYSPAFFMLGFLAKLWGAPQVSQRGCA